MTTTECCPSTAKCVISIPPRVRHRIVVILDPCWQRRRDAFRTLCPQRRRQHLPHPGALRARQQPEDGSSPPTEPSADLLFEQNRWKWPAVGGQSRSAPPPPPPPPPRPPQPGTQGGTRGRTVRSQFRRPPPPPPPPPPLGGSSSLPPWAEALVSRDPELQSLLAERPELWADLQRRVGKAGGGGYVPPPGVPDASVDPAAYERQVQQWLRYRRSQGGGGGQAAARQDDEIVSLALLYAAATLPILAFAMAAAW